MEHSPTSPGCQHALLARSPVGHVSVCSDCGVVYLSLDCVSVRLELTAFLALAEMLSQAQKSLQSTHPNETRCCREQPPVIH